MRSRKIRLRHYTRVSRARARAREGDDASFRAARRKGKRSALRRLPRR